jgi:hypothetical protein
VCAETVNDGEVVVFDQGDLVHVDCRHIRPLLREFSVTRRRRPPDGPAAR